MRKIPHAAWRNNRLYNLVSPLLGHRILSYTNFVIGSMFVIGGLIGALSSGPLSNKLGRLFSMRIIAATFIAGSGLQAISGNVFLFSAGRIIAGIGAGASTVVAPMYVRTGL
jgi:MFS family permease